MGFIKVFKGLMLIGIVSISFGVIFNKSICLFYNIIGIPCPACGMTRAWVYFIKGDIINALYFHPLFFIILFIPLLFLKRNGVNIFNTKQLNYTCLILLLIVVLVWIIRLILLFPSEEPMNFNYDALLPKIYYYFTN